jgi:Skp family chaperone for outer membrane proteins
MGTPEDETSATLTNDVNSTSSQVAAGSSEQTQSQTVDWEKRFKDTQAGYTKSRQEIAALKAHLTVAGKTLAISDEEKDRLEDLKYTDPDTWRKELGAIEQKQTQTYNEELAKTTKELTELEQRELAFNEFKVSHPDVEITDDVIAYDVPKRITSKLEKGEITFEAYLEEVYDYLKAPKVIGGTSKVSEQPNLSEMGGGSQSADYAVGEDIRQSYKSEIY